MKTRTMRFGTVPAIMVVVWITLFAVTTAPAAFIADLAADYKAGTAAGATSDSEGIVGTIHGNWHYCEDWDVVTTNGYNSLLTWYQGSSTKRGGSRWGYSGSVTGWGVMPVLANEKLFENPGDPPPAGHLMGHPDDAMKLAIQYVADYDIDDLSIDYRFEKPNSFGTAKASIIKSDGASESILLNQALMDGPVIPEGTLSGLGTLAAGESIWLFVDGTGNYAGDQSFLKLSIYGTTVPEPSTLALLCMGVVGFLTYTRRRRKH